MSKFRSASKYKHAVASVYKKELWYPDLKPSTGGDFNTIAASAAWIAVAWSSAGSVALLDVNEVGKRKTTELPLVSGHSSAITDLTFSPFDDGLLATGSEDCTVKLWRIPQGNKENINNPLVSLSGHKKRIESIKFHPTANNIIVSGSADKVVKIWDIEAGKEQLSLDSIHGDAIQAISWNWNGSLFATVCKDKKIRVIDPRANTATQVGDGHQGIKPSRVAWLGQLNKVATTGFSKMRERQFAVWDAANLSKPLVQSTVDSSTGVLDIYYDNDTQILYLAGKGDGSIKAVEITDTAPYYTDLTLVRSDDAQKSTCFAPKRSLDLMNTEVGKIYKLTASAVCPVGFSVPRKTKSEFQEDLYPPTPAPQPALKASEWFSGENRDPVMMQLKPTSNPYKFWEQDNSSSSSSASSSSYSTYDTPSTTASEPEPSSSYSSYSSSSSQLKQEEPAVVSEPTKVIQVVRSSKFRHIGGKGTKADLCYTGLQINPASNNSVIRANKRFFCVPWQGAGGRVAIIPLTRTGRQPDKMFCLECGSDCLDFDFYKFSDDLIATVTENAHVQIWKIPAAGLSTDVRSPTITMKGHTRRVTTVDFHPTASNLVVTSAGDFTIRFWDLEKQSEGLKVDGHNDTILNHTWNWDGSLLASASKDKIMRIIDPRNNNVSQRVLAHDGAKGFKAAWLGKQEQVVTAGFSKTSERTIALWDLRKLQTPVATKGVDNGAGVITPCYDPDTGVLYTPSKGDGAIKMFEINDEAPYIHFLTEYSSSVPANGVVLLPKMSCNVKECEIACWLKLAGDTVEPIKFSVPRTRMEYFQDDLFPPTWDVYTPVLTASEWLNGDTKSPIEINLQPPNMQKLSEAPVEKKEKKYDFKTEVAKEDSRFTKDKFLASYYNKMAGEHGEAQDQVLKQDLMEGVAAEEWD